MCVQRRLGIYIRYNSPSIIQFLEPLTGDLFIARFMDCHFDKPNFPSIGTTKSSKEEIQKNVEIFSQREKYLCHLDPRTLEYDNEV